jgi:hypothetical protein
MGTNKELYRTEFWLIESPVQHDIVKIDTPKCIRKSSVSNECSDAKWCTAEEAKKYMSPNLSNIIDSACEYIRKK